MPETPETPETPEPGGAWFPEVPHAYADLERWVLLVLADDGALGGGPVPWDPAGVHAAARRDWTAAHRAATSRALRRLEGRGLLVRLNPALGTAGDAGSPGRVRRTTSVRLTDLGVAAARWVVREQERIEAQQRAWAAYRARA